MKRMSPIVLSLLLSVGAAWAQPGEKSYAKFPTGEGDPDAITCRPPQPVPGERLNGPEVCKANSVWARYRRDGMDVAADGIHDVPLHSKSGITCNSVAMGAGGSTTTAGNLGMHCN
jgi:hypothetical protein